MDLHKDVPFAVKYRYFSCPLISRLPKRSKFLDWKFSLDFR